MASQFSDAQNKLLLRLEVELKVLNNVFLRQCHNNKGKRQQCIEIETETETQKFEIEIENLANNQVHIIMKWAMKFPLFDYRETQRKWFGIKGKPWYVFVAVKTHADGEVEVEF